ncbi:MAG: trans-2-enoyl-CoA reductase family protein [Treponema sp.]|nr:trans-2-enoyl-CoA reductase family protein [Treponema sp.]
MIIKPMVRNNICLNSHPVGCEKEVQRQIEYVKNNLKPCAGAPKLKLPKVALILGCSNGYGLASRIAAAFGYGASTVGVSWEKAAEEKRTGTPGYYHNTFFEREAAKAGLIAKTVDGDAFSDEIRAETIKAIREAAALAKIPAKVDLVIYSLASPVRTDPKTGAQYRSVIKPTGQPFSGTALNMMDGSITTVDVEPATEEEIANTVKVMGGEDWELWMEALDKEGLLSPETRTIAYSYIGPEHSWPVYKNGTIGKAKEDLERAAAAIGKKYSAWVSVNKALVTRSSAVIPVVQLYICCLFKVMKEMGLHEGCIEQIVRLYRERLYAEGELAVDSEGRIRMDDLEMREDVQKATGEKMKAVTSENVFDITDIAGVKHDFLAAHGFDVEGVDYEVDTNPVVEPLV